MPGPWQEDPLRPAIALRQLGRRLRQQREQAGKTLRSVQDAKLLSAVKLSRIEAGTTPVAIGDLWMLCRFYDGAMTTLDEWCLLAADTGTISSVGGATAPEWFRLYLALEAQCSGISTYHPELVHGLLQTKRYARAVLETDGALDRSAVEARLEAHLARQRLMLERSNHSLRVVVGAGALSLVVGSPAVMSEQLRHLQELDSLVGIDVRVLPWSSGAHPGMRGPFTILDFDDEEAPTAIYLETTVEATYLERADQVETYRCSFEAIFHRSVSIHQSA